MLLRQVCGQLAHRDILSCRLRVRVGGETRKNIARKSTCKIVFLQDFDVARFKFKLRFHLEGHWHCRVGWQVHTGRCYVKRVLGKNDRVTVSQTDPRCQCQACSRRPIGKTQSRLGGSLTSSLLILPSSRCATHGKEKIHLPLQCVSPWAAEPRI